MSEITRIRIWPSLSQEMYDELKEMAEKERRKIHEMAAVLIENAIKERQRQRKKNIKD